MLRKHLSSLALLVVFSITLGSVPFLGSSAHAKTPLCPAGNCPGQSEFAGFTSSRGNFTSATVTFTARGCSRSSNQWDQMFGLSNTGSPPQGAWISVTGYDANKVNACTVSAFGTDLSGRYLDNHGRGVFDAFDGDIVEATINYGIFGDPGLILELKAANKTTGDAFDVVYSARDYNFPPPSGWQKVSWLVDDGNYTPLPIDPITLIDCTATSNRMQYYLADPVLNATSSEIVDWQGQELTQTTLLTNFNFQVRWIAER